MGNRGYGFKRKVGWMGYNNIQTIGGCCLDCPERHHACHDTCETYQLAKAEYEDKKAKIKDSKAEETLYTTYKYKKILKENRAKRS